MEDIKGWALIFVSYNLRVKVHKIWCLEEALVSYILLMWKKNLLKFRVQVEFCKII
jgi:hypothetical protein